MWNRVCREAAKCLLNETLVLHKAHAPLKGCMMQPAPHLTSIYCTSACAEHVQGSNTAASNAAFLKEFLTYLYAPKVMF